MARSYLTEAVSTTKTPQSEAIPGTTQVANSAGGFTWEVDKWKRLERFLILGSEGGTYYISQQKLTKENIKTVETCVIEDGLRTVKVITEISDGGRAPKNDPALFALAVCISKGDAATKKAAAVALPKVARIGTHLFHFAQFANEMRGWGPVLRNAVADWYLVKDVNKLSYQLVKYQSRDGWSHRDLLRLAHPNPTPSTGSEKLKASFNWAVGKEDFKSSGELPPMIKAFEEAKIADEKRTIELIAEENLPRECIKTEYLKSVKVWEALLEKMPLTAMIRNLGNMTALGLVAPNSAATVKVISALGNREALKKARVHPLSVMLADATYRTGHGMKGSNTWTPVQAVRDAMEEAFYTTFDLVEPTNKRWFLGLDVSGSMTSPLHGYENFSCREASGLMAMVTMRTEKIHFVGGFTSGSRPSQWTTSYGGRYGAGFSPLDISARMKLETVVNKISNLDFGGTDCALPMIYALENKIPADVFVVYTDSETWAGNIHPTQALENYRQKMGIGAKLAVVAMTSNGFTIADPNDAGMLDVVGLDTTVPSVLADFVTDGSTKQTAAAEE